MPKVFASEEARSSAYTATCTGLWRRVRGVSSGHQVRLSTSNNRRSWSGARLVMDRFTVVVVVVRSQANAAFVRSLTWPAKRCVSLCRKLPWKLLLEIAVAVAVLRGRIAVDAMKTARHAGHLRGGLTWKLTSKCRASG